MLQCLDPCLAELCYVDTDSCIWSLSKPTLEECLLPSRVGKWIQADILADENGSKSCHGKMKLEGLFSAGKFKTLKIYRLYSASQVEGLNVDKPQAAYTRCKGINRYLAGKLPDDGFQSSSAVKISVHRNALKPTKKGEMFMTQESRSLAVPFNLKRHVTKDGLHSLPFSLL